MAITAAAGAGMRPATKDITDSLKFWGVGKIYTYGVRSFAMDYNGVKTKRRADFERDMKKLACTIRKNDGHISPNAKTKGLFYLVRQMHKKGMSLPVDTAYWEEQGWLGAKRPW